jgi:rhamnogalacturonan endolyase
MKNRVLLRSPGPWVGCLALIISMPALPAGAADPTIAKPAGNAAVTVAQDARYFTLDNGVVKAVINKRTGQLFNLYYKGTDLVGHDQGSTGGWEVDPSAAESIGGLTQSLTIDPEKNNGERAEISIKGVSGGQVGFTPGSPGGAGGGTTNMDQEIRYTMARGESGVHVYSIYTHPAAYGALNMPENRFILRVNQSFDWISVDADRNLLACGPRDWGTGVVVHAKEQRLMNTGPYKNSVEHKYSYAGVQYQTPAYGWSSTKEHVGVWFINPTIEYLSGGASKCELDIHWGDNDNPDPIILDYWRGTHYAGGATCNVAAGEEWSKVVGPIFVYVNALAEAQTPSDADLAAFRASFGDPKVPQAWTNNQTALWKDALAQAATEKKNWPYDWVNGVDYPHKDQRANVSGQLVLVDPQATSTKLPHLTIGLAYPDSAGGGGGRGGMGAAGGAPAATGTGPATGRGRGAGGGFGGGFGGGGGDYLHDAKHYQFWNDGTDDGKFTITQVRPGSYTLHAWADGVLGEFAQTSITVEAGKNIDLGKLEWKPVRYGKQIWDIGTPDRNTAEFCKGDAANYWLWGWPLRYGALFPDDVTYTIGKSDPAKDWFFEQVPHGTSDAWKNPEAKDPLNQRFGWVKAESLDQYPQTNTSGPWRIYGQGRATTWTIKFNLDKASAGQATLRVALCGADGSGLTVGVNGQQAGAIRPTSTNALRYNTNKGLWQERMVQFDAAMLKAGENQITLTVPAGEVTSGVVYDYLRLELAAN